MKLRCWPGCLAHLKAKDNAIVSVESYLGMWPHPEFSEPVPAWLVTAPRAMLCSHQDTTFPATSFAAPDAWLTPITPPPGSETTDERTEEAATA